MTRAAKLFRRLRHQEGGQSLVFIALAMIVLVGFAALVIDIGRVWVAKQKLQGAVDASALVAGQDLPNSNQAFTDALSYDGASGAKNQLGGYGMTPNAPVVTFECVSHAPNYSAGATPTCPTDSSSKACQPSGAQSPYPSGATTCNAVNVTETATVKTTFGGIFLPSFTVSASATSAMRGSSASPLNVYVIVDNTRSMTSACTGTVTGISGTPERLDCAKAGMQALLQQLTPCNSSTSCGTATANGSGQLGANVASPVDEVGLLVFPAITGNPPAMSTLNKEIDCSSSSSFAVTYPTYQSYTYNSGQPDGGIPAADDYIGYQAIALSSDYRPSSANATLNSTTSNLVASLDWGQCPGVVYPNGDYYGLKDIGGQGSYLAGAITEAQHLLNVNARAGAKNVIIVLSDGQMNNPKTFTDKNPCNSAVQAATQATAAGTTIYAIAYGSNGTVCPDTGYTYTDKQVMQDIASSAKTFFYDPNNGGLTGTFATIGTALGDPRLIFDCPPAPATC